MPGALCEKAETSLYGWTYGTVCRTARGAATVDRRFRPGATILNSSRRSAMKTERGIVIKRHELPLDASCTYAIRVRGRLDRQRWSQWFDGMTITVQQGETLISGPVPDQAALYSMLSRLRDLALPLLSVERIAGDG